MLRRRIITIAAVSMLFAGSAFAAQGNNAGNLCKDKDVVGSYTLISPGTDTDDVLDEFDRTYIRQLNVNAGGTAHQMRTGTPDYMLNYGTAAPELGSWVCRNDGKLLVTIMGANYFPVAADELFEDSVADVVLTTTLKTTYLFSVEDADTLKMVQTVRREYNMNEDLTDPSAGEIDGPYYPDFLYNRLIPSDADLTP